MSSLVLENASFAYPSRPERPVLNGIGGRLPLDGASLILGSNGSGKTALARLLAGLDIPSSGNVRWPDGTAAVEHRFRAGVVFEQPEFQFQGFSVAEELAGGLLYRGVERAAADKAARDGADRLGLGHLLEADLNSLDSGDKLAVLTTAFLILKPLLLVLDFSLTELHEPFRKFLLESTCGAGKPGLAVLSRRAEDLVLLPGASLLALAGGKLEPFPADGNGPEFLNSLGIALPWYAGAKTTAQDNSGWQWLTPPSK